MILRHVAGHVHGRDYHIDIDPVTLLVGDNEAGKSTVLGLPHLALGVHSSRSLPVVGTHKTEWEAVANFDTLRVARGYVDDNSYLLVNGRPMPATKGTKKVSELVGAATLWRLSDFQTLSSAKQASFVMDTVLADCQVTVRDVLEQHPESEALLGELDGDGNALAILARLQESAYQAKLQANRDVKSVQGAIKNGEKAIADRGQPPGGTVAYWRTQRDETQARIDELSTKVGAIQGNQRALASLTQRAESLAQGLEQAEAAAARLEQAEADYTKAKAWTASCEQRAERASSERGKLDGRRAALTYTDDEYIEAHRVVMAEGGPVVKLLEQAIHLLDDPTVPPEAYQYRPMELIRKAMAPMVPDDVDQEQLDELDEALAKAETKLTHAETMANDARRDEESKRLIRFDLSAKAAMAEPNRVELEQVRAEIAAAEVGSSADLELALGAEREALADIQRKLDRLVDDESIRQAQADRYEQETQYKAQAAKAAEREALARDVRAKVLLDALAPLAEPVSRICREAIGCSVEMELDPFAITLVRFDERIPLDTASHSQQIVTWLAFAAAVRSRLGGWRAVLVDDLEALTPERLKGFVRAMDAEIRMGHLDQFVGAVASDHPIDIEHATTVWLETP